MLLCLTAYGLGQVLSFLQSSAADTSFELKRKNVIKLTLRNSCFSLQDGHTGAGLTHLYLLDILIPTSILLVLACRDQLASALGLTMVSI